MRLRLSFATCLCIILLILVSPLFSAEDYEEQFDVTEGKAVDDGVVFIDGRYIQSPYRVVRRGLKLFINGNMIARPSRHIESPPLSGYDAPEKLSLEQRQKLFRGLEAARDIYETYLGRGYGYLFSGQAGHMRLSPYTVAYDLPKVVRLLTSNKTRAEKLAELQPRNWHLHIDIEPFVDNFVPSEQLSAKLAQKAEELLRVDDFGVAQASVDNGFVFFDGLYLETPYRIERRGLGVFINGKMIKQPETWPIRQFDGNTDPQMPAEINSESSIDDDIVCEYLSRKSAYVREHNPTQERDVMEHVYRTLPFIVEAQIDEDRPYILHITTTEGRTISQSLISMVGRRARYDKASVLQRAQSQFDYCQGSLSDGACYLLLSMGGGAQLSTGSAVERLKSAIEILRTEDAPDEKLQRLRDSGLNVREDVLQQMIRNYRPSTQLETRLRAMSSEN